MCVCACVAGGGGVGGQVGLSVENTPPRAPSM